MTVVNETSIMATLRQLVKVLDQRKLAFARIRVNKSVCCYTTDTQPPSADKTASPPPPPPQPAASPVAGEVDDNKSYKSVFEHNEFSYYDIDVDMSTDRLTQPSKYDAVVPKAAPPKK